MTKEEIEQALVEVIESNEVRIPEHVRANHYSLVRAGEYSVALDFVEDWIVEEARPISVRFYNEILNLRAHFGQRGRCEGYIREYLLNL